MHVANSLGWLSLALFSVAIRAAPASCCTHDFDFTPAHREAMMTSYMNIWNGDLGLANSTLMPKIHFEMDRHPVASGSEPTLATTAEEFLGLVMWSHQGWQDLNFSPVTWLGEDDKVALRWKYTAHMGANFTKVDTTLKAGDEVVYYGTDMLTLDKCTGKISSIVIAQDLLTFFYSLGVRVLPL